MRGAKIHDEHEQNKTKNAAESTADISDRRKTKQEIKQGKHNEVTTNTETHAEKKTI